MSSLTTLLQAFVGGPELQIGLHGSNFMLSCVRAAPFILVPGSGCGALQSVLGIIFECLHVCLRSRPRHCHPIAMTTVKSQAAEQCCQRSSHSGIACIQPQHLHIGPTNLSCTLRLLNHAHGVDSCAAATRQAADKAVLTPSHALTRRQRLGTNLCLNAASKVHTGHVLEAPVVHIPCARLHSETQEHCTGQPSAHQPICADGWQQALPHAALTA
jgi:hypothetical protein